jgi:nitrogen fixation-related uncharacterized protein
MIDIILLILFVPVALIVGSVLLLALGYAIDTVFFRKDDHLTYFNLEDEDIS